jgi:hypothetical protein
MDKDNLSCVAGVKVEVRKNKRYKDELDSGDEDRGRKTKDMNFFFLKIRGRTRFEDNRTTVPRQRRYKCLLVFLSVHRIIRKRTEILL